jgi:hypothetical protein
MYSSYCDCGKFINWVDEGSEMSDIEKQVDELAVSDEKKDETMEPESPFAWFISRGAEMCDVSDGVCKFLSVYSTEHTTKFIIIDSIYSKFVYITQIGLSK